MAERKPKVWKLAKRSSEEAWAHCNSTYRAIRPYQNTPHSAFSGARWKPGQEPPGLQERVEAARATGWIWLPKALKLTKC